MRRLTGMVCFLLGVLILARSTHAAPPGSGWGLFYADEFSGNSVDTMKWNTLYPWGNGHTHNHDAYMQASNLSVANGILTETAKRETAPDGKPFTSGMITTGNNKLNYTYGYAEARIKLPTRPGSWPAFWGLYTGWPPESDIMEFPIFTSGDTNQDYYISYHYTNSSGNAAAYGGWADPSSAGDLTTQFHTYGMDWTSSYIRYYFDGQLMRTVTDTTAIAQMQYMYLILNYAVGGWPGLPDTTQWPNGTIDTTQVDWVRVWKNTSSYPTLTSWTKTSNGSWDDGTAWSAGSPQLGTQIATFGAVAAGNIQVTWSNSRTVGGLILNSSTNYALGSSSGSLMLASSAPVTGEQPNGSMVLIDASGVSGSGINYINARLDLYNNVTLRSNPNKVLVLNGGITGPAGLRIESGQIVLNGAASYNGATTVTGGNLTLSGNGALGGGAGNVELGYETNNVVAVTMSGVGSKINGQIVRFSYGAGSQSSLTQSAGAVTAAGDLYLGYNGQATYNLSGNGALNANQNLQIGSYGQGGLNQSGGAVSVAGTPSLGRYAGGVGELNLSAGTFTQSNTSSRLVVGDQGMGTLSVGGSGALNCLGGLRLGAAPAAVGTVNLNAGGAIYTPLVDSSGGSSTFNFNGGQLLATASSAYFMQGLSGAFLQANGAIIDTGSNNITIAQALLEGDPAGGLLKKGPGALILAGNNAYAGSTTVENGALTISGDVVDVGPVAINGGSLLVNSLSASMQDVAGPGALTVGDGSVAAQLTADSVAVGSLTIGAGATLTIRSFSAGDPLTGAANLQAVPEPPTIILLIIAGLTFLASRSKLR